MAQPLFLSPRGSDRIVAGPLESMMKVRTLMFSLAVGLVAACQQSPYPTVSTGERGIDPMSRNVMQTQGASVRDPISLNPPPIRPAPPEIVIDGR
jgi:hypothetical protein